MGLYSRNKGARGEREVAALLKKFGFEARRGQQFAGGADSPDVVATGFPLHIEVKYTAQTSVPAWMEKAKRDAEGKPVCVFHRKAQEPWRVFFDSKGLKMLERMGVSVPHIITRSGFLSTDAHVLLACLQMKERSNRGKRK